MPAESGVLGLKLLAQCRADVATMMLSNSGFFRVSGMSSRKGLVPGPSRATRSWQTLLATVHSVVSIRWIADSRQPTLTVSEIAPRVSIQILENGIRQLTWRKIRPTASRLLLIIARRRRHHSVAIVLGTCTRGYSGLLAVWNGAHIRWRQLRWTAAEDQAGVPRNTMVFALGRPPDSWRWLHLSLRINALGPHVDFSVA